ncbi:hypothetical protein [Streptomyces sp. SD15]
MPAADLVLTGAQIRTLASDRPHATCVAVKDGLIAAVGDDADGWPGPGTETTFWLCSVRAGAGSHG